MLKKLGLWLFLLWVACQSLSSFAGATVTYNEPRPEFKPMFMNDIYWIGKADTNGVNMCWYYRDGKTGNFTGQVLCGVASRICTPQPGGVETVMYSESCKAVDEICVVPQPPGTSGLLNTLTLARRECTKVNVPKLYTINEAQLSSYLMQKIKKFPDGSTINPGGVTCVTGQTCDVIYNENGEFVDVYYRVDRNLAQGSPLSLNGQSCQHLISCQKMLAGHVWPLGMISHSQKPPANPPASSPNWVASTGVVPTGAVEIGNETVGQKAYVCRVNYSNALVTGKLVFGNTCFFAWYGKELQSKSYEVLIDNGNPKLAWFPWNNGTGWDVTGAGPRKAFQGGQVNNSQVVPCRGNFKGGVVGGHYVNRTCYLPFAGVENPVSNFELLGY